VQGGRATNLPGLAHADNRIEPAIENLPPRSRWPPDSLHGRSMPVAVRTLRVFSWKVLSVSEAMLPCLHKSRESQTGGAVR
jgi:hypothetical protein